MRICYDGGTVKTQPYYVEIIANAHAKRLVADVEIHLIWDDGKRNRTRTLEFEISRQRSADTIYGDLLGAFDKSGFYPTPREADELHGLITQACRVVKTA